MYCHHGCTIFVYLLGAVLPHPKNQRSQWNTVCVVFPHLETIFINFGDPWKLSPVRRKLLSYYYKDVIACPMPEGLLNLSVSSLRFDDGLIWNKFSMQWSWVTYEHLYKKFSLCSKVYLHRFVTKSWLVHFE